MSTDLDPRAVRGRPWVARSTLIALTVAAVLVLPACTHPMGAPAGPGTPEGYGRNATGGRGAPPLSVTDLGDSGPGTLRAALAGPGRRWVRFSVSGTIHLASPLDVTSDTTIDGRGRQVTISGQGLVLSGAHNVIIKGLRFRDGAGESTDAIQITDGSRDVWIDHCDLANYGDGLVDITRGSTDVTVSWNRFTDHDKVLLINTETDPGRPVRVTLHHNLFDGTNQRHPLVRWATVHAYNNHLRGWGQYGMQAEWRGELASEANVFEAVDHIRGIRTEGDFGQGTVRSTGDLALNGAVLEQRDPDDVFDPAEDYIVDVAPADRALAAAVDSRVGP